jgi:hypothetical protein
MTLGQALKQELPPFTSLKQVGNPRAVSESRLKHHNYNYADRAKSSRNPGHVAVVRYPEA